jgi:hypothetical protein
LYDGTFAFLYLGPRSSLTKRSANEEAVTGTKKQKSLSVYSTRISKARREKSTASLCENQDGGYQYGTVSLLS